MKVLVNISESKKDLVKAGNTTRMFKDVIGEKITMTGAIIYEKDEVNDKTGEVETKKVCCVRDEKGEYISTISPTVENSLQLIVASYEPEEIKAGLPIEVKSKKSNGGRDFIYIDLV